MKLIFNLQTGQFEILNLKKTSQLNGSVNLGTRIDLSSDLELDFGDRANNQSIVDSGDRILTSSGV